MLIHNCSFHVRQPIIQGPYLARAQRLSRKRRVCLSRLDYYVEDVSRQNRW